MQLAHAAGVEPHVDAGDLLGDAELALGDLAGPAAALEPHVRGENGNFRFATVPWSVGGGMKMSGFCISIGRLRGPGSVPPRPGRIGCGGLPCPDVCALAEAAAVTRPAAPVARTVRRDGAMGRSPSL
jgi:hypothetical protein